MKNSSPIIHLFLYAMIFTLNSCNVKETADLIVFNATVYTCDETFSTVESFAVKDGKIIASGTSEDIRKKYRSENNIDAEGKFIYPGFYDAHCHFSGYGLNKELYADLTGATSADEVVERLLEFRKTHDHNWIRGRGWNQNLWKEQQFPDKTILDKHFPDVPVYLVRVDGHAAWVNSKALETGNITKHTKVKGGKVLLTGGEPNGILIDEAMELVRQHIPSPDQKTIINALLQAQEDCFAYGITSVGEAGISAERIRLIDSLQQNGQLQMNINAMLDPSCEGFEDFVRGGIYTTDMLTVRSIKLYADGALGSRGACLLEEYSDDPGNLGIIVHQEDYIYRIAEMAKEYGWQMCIHAIGDSANRLVLNIYAELLGGKNNLRWRIEHAQVIHPDDFAYFADYNIIPSIQSTHATSDMYWAEARLGSERIPYAYAYRKLLEQNGWLCNGTDFPVEHISPFLTFFASVARKDLNGYPEGGFQMENALSRKETLLSMTLWAAMAGFEENFKGSIEPGKRADFIILDRDIMLIDEMMIPETVVLGTYVRGQKVFGK